MNSILDTLAVQRRARAQHAASVQWGPWGEIGMASKTEIARRWRSQGYGLISSAQGLAALQAAVLPSSPEVWAVLPVNWSTLLPHMPPGAVAFVSGVAITLPADKGAAKAATTSQPGSTGLDLAKVLALVARTVGSPTDADKPLMEAGLDSLGAVELRNVLHRHSSSSSPRRADWLSICSRVTWRNQKLPSPAILVPPSRFEGMASSWWPSLVLAWLFRAVSCICPVRGQ